MSDLTDFSWDRLYVFGPYTPIEEIESRLGIIWLGGRFGSFLSLGYFPSIEWNEGVTLLIFTENGHLVEWLEFPRLDGDFASISINSYNVGEAVFSVDNRERIQSVEN